MNSKLHQPILGLALLAGLTDPMAAEVVGYAHRQGTVYEIGLKRGVEELVWRELVSTDPSGSSSGLAQGTDERLYAMYWSSDLVPPRRLATIDLESGETSLLGPSEAAWDLAFDGEERLWTILDGDLAEVDLDGTITPRPVSSDHLRGIAYFDGVLYSIARTPSNEFWLVEVDPLAGTSTPLVPMEGFVGVCGDSMPDVPTSMSFDSEGGLWVTMFEIVFGCIIIPDIRSAWMYFPDPSTGVPEPRQYLGGVAPTLFWTTVVDQPNIIEIPTIHPSGVAAFATLLILAAWRRIHVRS